MLPKRAMMSITPQDQPRLLVILELLEIALNLKFPLFKYNLSFTLLPQKNKFNKPSLLSIATPAS
jgi:hypothetical protein